VSAPTQSVFRLCAWALRYALRRTGPLAIVVAAMLARVGLDVLKPWPMALLIDHVLRHKTLSPRLAALIAHLPGDGSAASLIGWTVAGTLVIFLLSWAVGVATSYANISLGQRMTYDLAADLLAKFQHLSLRFHASKKVGDSVRRVTADCACVSTIVKDALLPVISSAIALVTMFFIMWRIDVALTLLAVAVAPYMIMVFRSFARPMEERSYEQQEAESRIYEVVEQTFSAMPVVQAFGREPANDKRFRGAIDETMRTTLAATTVQMKFKCLIGLATAVGTAAILWIGTQHALAGRLTPGEIMVFLSYLASLYVPLEAIMYTTSTIQGASGSARRVMEILQTEADVRDRPGAVALRDLRGAVQFDNVTFG